MVFATLCMGATFPVASQLYSTKFTILGRSIGNIYSLNTLGSIAGSLFAGFALMPVIGTERTIIAGIFFNAAMALLLLTDTSHLRPSPDSPSASPPSPSGRGQGEGLVRGV